MNYHIKEEIGNEKRWDKTTQMFSKSLQFLCFLDNQIKGQLNLQLLRNRITNCQVKAGGITSYQQM